MNPAALDLVGRTFDLSLAFLGLARAGRFVTIYEKSPRARELFSQCERRFRVFVKSDDLRLIDATLAGSPEAFGELVLKYQDRLYATLVHVLGSMADARDVSQEAFLAAYQKLGSFRRESSFYSWLFRIAYNAAVTSRRKRRSVAAVSFEVDAPSDPVDDSVMNDPSSRLQTEESRAQVRGALAELTSEYRDALIMKEIEGLRYEEIASLLDCPIGTVRSRIHRARQLLRDKLVRLVEGEP